MRRNMDVVEVEVNGTQYKRRAAPLDFARSPPLATMSRTLNLTIHWSQFPDRIQAELRDCFRTRRLNHKFLYESLRQTRKWLALHQACSPSRTDPDCAATYDRAFEGAVELLPQAAVHLIGLGCGGGQKDTRLLRLLQQSGRPPVYTPVDVGPPMVLVAAEAAQEVLGEDQCFPLVCDLALADDLPALLSPPGGKSMARIVSFFGMIPNFEPGLILDRLAGLLRPGDFLLLSANLAPGPDYEAGVNRILPLYDNALTRDWLQAFLYEVGFEPGDGEVRFSIEPDQSSGLRRVIAHYHFGRSRTVEVAGEPFEFQPGDRFQLFFSYRHTPRHVRELLARHDIRLIKEWITRSGEEGVFLAQAGQPG